MDSYILDFVNFFLDKNVFVVYLLFFASNLMQMLFPPHPGDVILIFQGYISAINSSYNLLLLYLNAVTATFLGSHILFALGYHKGDSVFNLKIIKRFIKEKYIKRAEKLFKRFGVFAIALSKFVPGVNAIIIILSGTFKLNKRVAYLSFLLSAAVHHAVLLLLGRFLGHNMELIMEIIKTYNRVAIIVVVLAIVSFLVYKFIFKASLKSNK